MADGAPSQNRTGRIVAWFVVAVVVLLVANATRLGFRIDDALRNLFEDVDTKLAVSRLFRTVAQFISASYSATLFTAGIVAVLGAATRTLVRARVRAGFADVLDRVRTFAAARPRVTAALVAAPALVWTVSLVRLFAKYQMGGEWDTVLAGLALPATATVLAQIVLARRGLRALLAPTLSEEEASGDVRADGFTFTAVAVTTETVGAVAALAALSLVMVGLSYALPTSALVRSPAFAAALVAYLGLAGGGAMLFRRASRISVGLDGIHVSGSARERFISYREIDGARVNGQTISLYRGERIVLRLQLHGEDAIRRAPLAARINAAIAVAEAQRDEPAVSFVASASSDALSRAADGASSYREAAPTREKLWQALESPAVDAAGRKAAATALARDGDSAERTRLRVAADQCAEPSVRAVIDELLEADEDVEPARALKVRRV